MHLFVDIAYTKPCFIFQIKCCDRIFGSFLKYNFFRTLLIYSYFLDYVVDNDIVSHLISKV